MRLLQHFGHNGTVRTLGTAVFGSGPATALRFNIKGYDQVAPPRGARESVPQGHLIVAHYEVVGKGVKDSSVPGRSNPKSLARIRPRERKQPIDRPLRDGSLLKKRDPPLRSGLLSNAPSSFALRATADRQG
jgi:hypothetical protein